ncbi:kinase-like domain-containing protein [Jimgerdemannia flammicorona]|uniref:Kinase-like domain-containing protein n=2 Tax=Jimgerdemannia flammicorona TaxID=994334 RepID=A0A433QMI7_9FUNG|nr:kinase-like domain-containing protein [Jimgerdemannia flammicorona]RUS30992.1 kinase-like domain-containing protein [Jimgerdemannia flammicorona]
MPTLVSPGRVFDRQAMLKNFKLSKMQQKHQLPEASDAAFPFPVQQEQQRAPPTSQRHPLPPTPCELPPSPPNTPAIYKPNENVTVSSKLLDNHQLHSEFLARYSLGEELGSGGFGFVVSATQYSNNREVAVKFIFKDKVPENGWACDAQLGVIPMEIYVLKNVRHANIIEFIDTFQDDKYFYLVMELHGTQWEPAKTQLIHTAATSLPSPPADYPGSSYFTPAVQQKCQTPPTCPTQPTFLIQTPSISTSHMEEHTVPQQDPSLLSSKKSKRPSLLVRRSSCDLFECIEQHSKLSEEQARIIFRQIVECVHFLDAKGICHRDIKDENIVIDSNYKVKLIDFGSAVAIPRPQSCYFNRFYGTVTFASPEILLGEPYRAEPAEIWSLGILLYTILYGEVPFPNQLQTISGPFAHPSVQSSPECMHLLTRMLAKNPDQRATIEEVIRHPWLG